MSDAESKHAEIHHGIAVFFNAVVLAFQSFEVDFEIEGYITHHAEHKPHNDKCARKQFGFKSADNTVFNHGGKSGCDKEKRRCGFENNRKHGGLFIPRNQEKHEHHDAGDKQNIR